MVWFALLLILSGGTGSRTKTVRVQVPCDDLPEVFHIVVWGIDTPHNVTTRKGAWYEDDLPTNVAVVGGIPAILHLHGRRSDCQKSVMTIDAKAEYAFTSCEKKTLDLVIVPDPEDVSALYERRVAGDPPDCVLRGSFRGQKTIEDVIPNTENVVLQFGQANKNAPGLNVRYVLRPKQSAASGRSHKRTAQSPEEEADPLTIEARTLDKVHVVTQLVLQQAVATGYLSSIYIDVDDKALEHLKSLTFQLVPVVPKK